MICAALFALSFALRPAAAAELKVGDKAPEFELKGSDGKLHSLKEFKGKKAIVLAWFPRAFTGGCTAECKSLKENGEAIRKFDVAYFTASTDQMDGEKGNKAFAESLGRFRENLGGVEQILQESSQTIVGRNLTELEGKVSDLKHQVVEELYKSAEWYEKKAQTQIQNQADRAIQQAANQLREKAGEVSSVFASELDHSSRNFVGHTQTQMEEVVRESFERARPRFSAHRRRYFFLDFCAIQSLWRAIHFARRVSILDQ
jgi:BMFP domain-containing protein YqiC